MFVIILVFFFLAVPCGLWDLSSPIRDWGTFNLSSESAVLTTGQQGIPSRIFFNTSVKMPTPYMGFETGAGGLQVSVLWVAQGSCQQPHDGRG